MAKNPIVIGGNHHNALGVVRSLGWAGVHSDVIITTNVAESFVLKSKYVDKGFIVNGSEAAMKLLLTEFIDRNEKPVIISCGDQTNIRIDQYRNKLENHFMLPGIKQQGRVSELMNKKVMAEYAVKYGLEVAPMVVLNSETIDITDNLPFPCITKPIDLHRLGHKEEVVICKDNQQLKSFLKRHEGRNFIVQKFIDKILEFQLIGCSLRDGDLVIIPGKSEILRQFYNDNTGFLHYTPIEKEFEETVDKTKNFIKGIGYSGLFSVEFIRDNSGRDYFLEINFRNDGNGVSVYHAGVNLPYIWYLTNIGADFSKEIKPVHEEYVMPEFGELGLYKIGKISYRQMKEDMDLATSFFCYSPDDPAPTIGWKKFQHEKRMAFFKRFINYIIPKRYIK